MKYSTSNVALFSASVLVFSILFYNTGSAIKRTFIGTEDSYAQIDLSNQNLSSSYHQDSKDPDNRFVDDQPGAEAFKPILLAFKKNAKWKIVSDSMNPKDLDRKLGSKRDFVVTDRKDVSILGSYREESAMPYSDIVTWERMQNSKTNSGGLNFVDKAWLRITSLPYNQRKEYFANFEFQGEKKFTLKPNTCQKVETVLSSRWSNSSVVDDDYKITNISETKCPTK
jgi:hypothetical protein